MTKTSKTKVYKLNSDTNKGFSCASVFQGHPGKVERRKASLTQYFEALPCAACMLHHHAMSWYPGRQTETISTPILQMWLWILSNIAKGEGRQRDSLDPLCNAHTPPGTWSSGHCWGSCRAVPWLRSPDTAGDCSLLPRHPGWPLILLPVHLLLCIPCKAHRQNSYTLTLYFLQKMLVTFLSQNKRIQKSTSEKDLSDFSRARLYPSITCFMFNCHSVPIILP